MDAHQLVSQTALTPVADVVDTNDTVVAKLPKALLRGARVMDGVHDRLRALAGSWAAPDECEDRLPFGRLNPVGIARAVTLFVLAGIAEIGGGYLVWRWGRWTVFNRTGTTGSVP
jgi:hypothetical protein